MPRKNLIRTPEYPYHVYARSNNREYFSLSLEDLWPIFVRRLREISEEYLVNIHAFLLMANHYHLIISTPNSNLDLAMNHFQRETAKEANLKSQRINHFYGGRYRWSLINSERYYWAVVKYVFRNPVRAGICGCVEEYRYSSLTRQGPQYPWLLNDFYYRSCDQIEINLEWLNEPFLTEQENGIRAGLRRYKFKPPATENGTLLRIDGPRPKK